MARALTVKALQIAKTLGAADGTIAVAPEATLSSTSTIPTQFLVSIQGKQFVLYTGLLHLATQQGLLSLKARFISVTADMALAEATAMFHDGRTFTEAVDATPSNVGSRITPHFARMALTRAKARALCAVKAA